MPHKKKKAFHRNAQRSAEDFYEKPPTAVVAGKKTKQIDDDTPKSFLRIIKRKSRKELIAEGKITSQQQKQITIQPGESFNDFRRRVDKEIPVRMGSMGKHEGRKKKKKPKPMVKNEGEDDEEDEPKKKRRRGKGKRSVSPDPWAVLKKDVPFNQPVQAPPTLPAPTRKMKSSLPNSLSGARREVLEAEREDVIAKYRQLMGRS